MKTVSHKKVWSRGAVQMHLDPPQIPLIKIKNNPKLYKDSVEIKLCKILRKKSWIFNSLKSPCLTMSRRSSSCCLYRTFKWILMRREQSLLAQRYSVFVCYYVATWYVKLTCFLLRWEVQPCRIYTTLFWV